MCTDNCSWKSNAKHRRTPTTNYSGNCITCKKQILIFKQANGVNGRFRHDRTNRVFVKKINFKNKLNFLTRHLGSSIGVFALRRDPIWRKRLCTLIVNGKISKISMFRWRFAMCCTTFSVFGPVCGFVDYHGGNALIVSTIPSLARLPFISYLYGASSKTRQRRKTSASRLKIAIQ